MVIKDWKKDLENKKAGMIQCIHYIRKDNRAIISLNLYDDGFHFSHFPLGDNSEGKYFVKKKLTINRALKLSKLYMKSN